MSGHLLNGRFKMNILEAGARNALFDCIRDLESSKTAIWDPELVQPATLITTAGRLKELGVIQNLQLFHENFPVIKTHHVIFIVRPGSDKINRIAEIVHQLSRDHQNNTKKEFRIIFLPRATQMCERILQERGVRGSVDIKSADFELFPLDTDLLSMEFDHVFREYMVEHDTTKLRNIASALRQIEAEYGPFPRIIGRGPAAKIVAKHFIQPLGGEKKTKITTPTFHQVILIDRQIDCITPMTTQLTYEGLIDEIFGLNSTLANFPLEKFLQDEETGLKSLPKKKEVYLNSSDDIYAELRDRNFNGVGPALKRKAQVVAQQKEKRHDRTMENMKKFVNMLPQLLATEKSLALHTTIAELIKEKTVASDFLDNLQAQQELLCGIRVDRLIPLIDDAISKKDPILQVVRLICLQSLVGGGIKSKILEHYKKGIIQTYGIQYIIPITNLEKALLIRPFGSHSRNYSTLKRTLRLIIEDDSEIEPNDISYTHSIYAPLSVRLIQNFRNWNSLEDVLEMVPGPTVEHNLGRIPTLKADERQLILVFFIGGCTYSEVSALRFLSQKDDLNVDFIIATTSMINGSTFIKSVMMAEDYSYINI